MPTDFLPILVFLLLGTGFGLIAMAIPPLFGPRIPNQAKLEPYESGKIPYGDARRRLPIHYYKIAILFVIFDVEVVFLYPWAVVARQLKLFGLIEMGIFLFLLVFGLIYEWKKGGLELE